MHQLGNNSLNDFSIFIWTKLPKHNSWMPFSLLVSPSNSSCQCILIHISSIRSITCEGRLSNHYFLKGNSSITNLLHRSSLEISTWTHEKLLIGIVCVISLVIKLDIVKVNQITDLLIYVNVCAIFVSLRAEIWSLRGVSDDVIGYYGSEPLCKDNKPLLPRTLFHCCIILPINVYAI